MRGRTCHFGSRTNVVPLCNRQNPGRYPRSVCESCQNIGTVAFFPPALGDPEWNGIESKKREPGRVGGGGAGRRE